MQRKQNGKRRVHVKTSRLARVGGETVRRGMDVKQCREQRQGEFEKKKNNLVGSSDTTVQKSIRGKKKRWRRKKAHGSQPAG